MPLCAMTIMILVLNLMGMTQLRCRLHCAERDGTPGQEAAVVAGHVQEGGGQIWRLTDPREQVYHWQEIRHCWPPLPPAPALDRV